MRAIPGQDERDALFLHTVPGIVNSGSGLYNGAIGIRPLRRFQGEA